MATAIAHEYGANPLDGVHNDVNLTGAFALYDGSTSYTDIYTTNLNTLFDGGQGVVICRAKVLNSGVWTDGIARRIVNVSSVGGDMMSIFRRSTNDNLRWEAVLGGTSFRVTDSGITNTSFMTLALYWSDASNDGEMKAYSDGSQFGSTVPVTETHSGVLDSAECVIGADTNTPTLVWSGNLSDCIITLAGADVSGIDAKMSAIHTSLSAATLSLSDLNTHFGAGDFAWWKLSRTPAIKKWSLHNRNLTWTMRERPINE